MCNTTIYCMEKICTRCHQTLPLDQFGNRDGGKYKLSACKTCNRKRIRTWRRTEKGKSSHTKSQRIGNRKRKIWLLEQLNVVCCELCRKENHPAALDFHHKDQKEKKFNIATALQKNKKTLLAEAKKCQVICSNCHRKLHWPLTEL